jgi:hypothetical protein
MALFHPVRRFNGVIANAQGQLEPKTQDGAGNGSWSIEGASGAHRNGRFCADTRPSAGAICKPSRGSRWSLA